MIEDQNKIVDAIRSVLFTTSVPLKAKAILEKLPQEWSEITKTELNSILYRELIDELVGDGTNGWQLSDSQNSFDTAIEKKAKTSPMNEGPVRVEYNVKDYFSYSLAQNDIPVVDSITIENHSARPLKELSVRLSFEPPVVDSWTAEIKELAPGAQYNLRDVSPKIDHDYLVNLNESKKGYCNIEVYQADQVIAQHHVKLEILAYNEWKSDPLPSLLAAFVMPNHPVIGQILKMAAKKIEELTGDPALDGYQSHDPERVTNLAKAIYLSIQELDVTYVNPPASFRKQGQKVRTPEQVLAQQMGTCLDLSLLYCACLEQAGVYPTVLLTEGHAFMGVWIEKPVLQQPVWDDVPQIKNEIDSRLLLVLDSSTMVVKPELDFEQAIEKGKSFLDDEFRFMLDIYYLRELTMVRPLPSRMNTTFSAVEHAPQIEGESNHLSRERIEQMLEAARKEGARDTLKKIQEEAIPESARKRLERWSGELLDISLRNKLVNVRIQNVIQLCSVDVGALEDCLAEGAKLQILSKPDIFSDSSPRSSDAHEAQTGKQGDVELAERYLKENCLLSPLDSVGLGKRLKKFARELRQGLEEGGIHTLYIAIGMLSWYETKRSTKERLAPLILVPVTLKRKNARQPYRLTLADEEPVFNHTLLEMLRHKFGLRIEALETEDLPRDHAGLDVEKIFDIVRAAIRGQERWQVKGLGVLGQFKFNKLVMYRDLTANQHHLLKNSVVQHLSQNAKEAFTNDAPFPLESELDDILVHRELCCPKDADSSQLVAIEAARRGMTYVLQGPPGTGKSQTITNLIAALLSEDKTVLFVSEKMAALEVVKSRLEGVGLGEFCLELHSNKTNKKDVLNQLTNILDAGFEPHCEKWEATTHSLSEKAKSLNAYVRKIHDKREQGFSLYQGMTRLQALGGTPNVAIEFGVASSMNKEQLEHVTNIATKLADAHREIGEIANHPFRLAGLTQFTPQLTQELPSKCDEVLECLRAFRELYAESCGQLLPGEDFTSLNKIRAFMGVAEVIVSSSYPRIALLQEADIENAHRQLVEIAGRGKEGDDIEQALLERWKSPLFELKLEELIQKYQKWGQAFFLLAFFMLWTARKILRSVSGSERLPGNSQISSDLDSAALRNKLRSDAEKDVSGLGVWVGVVSSNDKERWHRVAQNAEETLAIREALRTLSLENTNRERLLRIASLEGREDSEVQRYRNGLENLLSSWENLTGLLNPLCDLLEIDLESGFRDETDFLSQLETMLIDWGKRPQLLRQITVLRNIENEAKPAGMSKFVSAMSAGDLGPESARNVAEKSYHLQWVNHVVGQDSELANFSVAAKNRLVDDFRTLDQQYIDMSSDYGVRALTACLPQPGGTSGEVGVLKREQGKKRSHLPIRRLFEKIPTLIRRLKPCLLMSPLSVAQYLDPSLPGFDVVVFDEASQIPVPEAIGAIARGKQMIVVGDTRQMPPTNMFSRGASEEEAEPGGDDIIEELESILDECIAARLPEIALRWHYRSRHESLITFSNFNYYESNLFTFPAADDRRGVMGVSHIPVPDGVYDAGATRTNLVEAKALVDEVVRRLRDPVERTRSIGIVTFSAVQMILIEDLLEEKRKIHPEIEPYFGNGVTEKVFVKNLENVQGDERDVILFSVCYGPNAAGKISMNFGPLNKLGGERRLNVAVTRAKQQLIVFSTLRPEDIDLKRTRAKGAHHLKHFLEYASRGIATMAEAREISTGRSNDGLESTLKRMLEAKGWKMDTQVGNSAFRIDLAVRDPAQEGFYLAGIECDGEAYGSASTARDRDRLRSAVLDSLGWKIINVWSVDFWMDPENTIERIHKELTELAAHAASGAKKLVEGVNTRVVEVNVESSKPERSDVKESTPPVKKGELAEEAVSSENKLPVYRLAPKKELFVTDEHFYNSGYTTTLVKLVEDLAIVEAPIHKKRIERIAMEQFSLSRATKRVRERMANILSLCKLYVKEDFVWTSQSQCEKWSGFRVPSDSEETARAIDEIASKELAEAALYLLGKNLGMDRDELIKETAKVFGVQRVGSSAKSRLADAVTLLVSSEKAQARGEQIVLGKKS